MGDSEQDWIRREVQRLTAQHGDIPPPWVFSSESHPYSIEWRMGGGESYIMVFHDWWETCRFDEGQRIMFFRKYPPPPRWLEWMIEAIWDVRGWEQEEEFDYKPYFDRVEALGFGSKTDFDQDIEDPKWIDG